MADPADEQGWSIHVPSTGFVTEEVESPPDIEPLPPGARRVRLVVPDDKAPDLPDPATP